MSDCIFCKIARKEIKSKLLYEDEQLVAIHDLHPVAPVHLLLIPKAHHRDVLALAKAPAEESAAISASMLKAIKQLSQDFQIDERGFRLINNCGLEGGQSVMHLHVHLIGGKTLPVELG